MVNVSSHVPLQGELVSRGVGYLDTIARGARVKSDTDILCITSILKDKLGTT